MFQFDRLKNMPVIIINVHLRFQSVGFFQASVDAIPGSKDTHGRLIGDAAPPKLSVSFILWYFGKQKVGNDLGKAWQLLSELFPPRQRCSNSRAKVHFSAWGRFR